MRDNLHCLSLIVSAALMDIKKIIKQNITTHKSGDRNALIERQLAAKCLNNFAEEVVGY